MYDAIIFTDITDPIISAISIGAYKMASTLRKNGYSCLVVNNISSFSVDEICTLIDVSVGSNTSLVGFSLTFMGNLGIIPTPDNRESLIRTRNSVLPQGIEFENLVISKLKEKNDNIKIVVGGSTVTRNFSNKNIDYVCLGFGEVSIVNLMSHLRTGSILHNSTKNIWGRIIIEDSNEGTYEFSKDSFKWEYSDILNYKTLPIEIGRGCIFRCKFCSYPMNGRKNLDFVKDPELLYKELKDNFEQFGIKSYIIVDDTFNDHIEKLIMIREVIRRLNFTPVFWCYARLDLLCVHRETLDILYDIGVRAIFLGVETLNEKAGRAIGKGYSSDKQVDMIQYIKKRYPDVVLHCSFILGLPNEPLESFNKTFNLILNQEIPTDSWILTSLAIPKLGYAHYTSEMTRDYAKFGYEDIGTPENYPFINWKNSHTDYKQVTSLSSSYMEQSRQSEYFKLSGDYAMYLINYGLDFSEIMKMARKDIDWNYIIETLRVNFLNEYKKLLLEYLREKYENTI